MKGREAPPCGSLSEFLDRCPNQRHDEYLTILVQHLPNVIYRQPDCLWKHKHIQVIRQHIKQLAITLLLGRRSIESSFSMIDDFTIRRIHELSWKPMTSSGLTCSCGNSAPLTCTFTKCGLCCHCPAHTRRVASPPLRPLL